MKTEHFEQAIAALGVQGLEITKFSYTLNGQVAAVYARMGELTYVMWDYFGHAFRFDIPEGTEACTVVSRPEYLDYRRDTAFDLKF